MRRRQRYEILLCITSDQGLEDKIMEYFREEQVVRAKLKMKFPTPDYQRPGHRTGNSWALSNDFRWAKAFPIPQRRNQSST